MIFGCYFFLINIFTHIRMSSGTHWHPISICRINEIHLEISQAFPKLLVQIITHDQVLKCASPFFLLIY